MALCEMRMVDRACPLRENGERKDLDADALGEVGEGGDIGARETGRGEKRLLESGDVGRLKRVGRVVDLAAIEPAPVAGVEQVTLGQEVLQGAGRGGGDRAFRHALDRAGGWLRAGPEPFRRIGNPPGRCPRAGRFVGQAHSSVMVGKMEPGPRGDDGQRVGCVQAEEPDPRVPPFDVNVRSDVRLMEAREEGNRRDADRSDATHGEWNESNVRFTLVEIELQAGGEERANPFRRNFPMEKKEKSPILPHHGGSNRAYSWRVSIDGAWESRGFRKHRSLFGTTAS